MIIKADDFGYTRGVSHGIMEAHLHGVVSSTSLMVDAPWAPEAGALARQHPTLGVGLHFVATSEGGPLFDVDSTAAVERELDRQYQRCCDLLSRPPTHLDSHGHFPSQERRTRTLFLAWAEERHLPLRALGAIHFSGGFYGHRFDEEWRPYSTPEFIGVENLLQILCALPDGVTELACHPGYFSPDLDSYGTEREFAAETVLTRLLHDTGM